MVKGKIEYKDINVMIAESSFVREQELLCIDIGFQRLLLR